MKQGIQQIFNYLTIMYNVSWPLGLSESCPELQSYTDVYWLELGWTVSIYHITLRREQVFLVAPGLCLAVRSSKAQTDSIQRYIWAKSVKTKFWKESCLTVISYWI